MATHELKVWPQYFDALLDGSKTFEVRKNDRDYQVGDTLVLKEWGEDSDGWQHYTSRKLQREVTYILQDGQFGISDEYVVLGLTNPLYERVIKAAKEWRNGLIDKVLGPKHNLVATYPAIYKLADAVDALESLE